MENIFIVCWGHASIGDDGNSIANCGVVGAYTSRKQAEEALKKDIKSFADSLVDGLDEEDTQEILNGIQYYGSVEEGYFEADYEWADNSSEYRVEIVEQKTQED
jgi:hypothetical protein